MSETVRVVVAERAIVGESPMWSTAEQALYWIDGRNDAIYRLNTRDGTRARWTVPARVNGVGLAAGGLVVALKSGIALLDTASGAFRTIAVPAGQAENVRMNDAKVDRAGRFWFGTMHDDAAEPIGRVFRLDRDLQLNVVDEHFTIPNGFAFSPDHRRMYLADSKLRTIFVYDFDLASGAVTNRRPFAQAAAGGPDGATIDERGFVWSACIGGSALARYRPDGDVDRIVALPTERPTSVIFGGPDLKTLFVTTASRTLSAEQRAAQPLAGAVLAIDVDVPGLPEPIFRG